MIYKVIILLLLVSVVLYYIFCFLEIFDVLKFTGPNTKVKFPLMLVPFYYLIKEDKKEEPKKPRVKKIVRK